MKSLNKSDELWTNMSAKEVEDSNYAASCCFNIQVNNSAQNHTKKSEPVESK